MQTFSLVSGSRGYSLVSVHGLLIAVASLVVEHVLWVTRALVVVAHGLSCPMACEIFPDQRMNLCPLH